MTKVEPEPGVKSEVREVHLDGYVISFSVCFSDAKWHRRNASISVNLLTEFFLKLSHKTARDIQYLLGLRYLPFLT